MKSVFLLLVFAIAASAQETGPAAFTVPDYSRQALSCRVPFGNTKPVDFAHLLTMLIRVSINGGPPMRMQVDTGSTGVIAGADDVPDIAPDAPAGSINYVSSGVELKGVWTPATIAFLDAKDEHGNVATAVVPVLAVRERIAHEGAVNSGKFQTTKNPKIYMFGVGSGRGKVPQQEKNPFLNLKEMQDGTMRRGYMIGTEGFTLGLTAASVGEGFLFEKLKERTGPPGTKRAAASPKDWDAPSGWVTVGGAKQQMSGMLLDTGLTNMMIEFPELAGISEVEDGTEIGVHLLDGRLSYDFKVGDFSNPATPRRVSWMKYSAGPLINTGLRALALYDYLYDADGGYFGLRPRKTNAPR